MYYYQALLRSTEAELFNEILKANKDNVLTFILYFIILYN